MPWYREGKVAIAAGQTTVTGTGTNFAANSRVGDALQGPDGRWYEVTNIASGTVLSIYPAYQGATIAAGTYGLAPMQGYVKESADRLRQIVEQFGSTLAVLGVATTAPKLRENIGAAARGANNDITSLSGLTTALSVAQGGTGGTTDAAARANLGVVGVSTTQDVGGLKTFTNAIRSKTGAPGLWMEDTTETNNGVYQVLNGNAFQFQQRLTGFGSVVSTMMSFTIADSLARFAFNPVPSANNGVGLGSATYRWSQVYAVSGTINTSDARKKTPVEGLTPDEISAAKALSKEIGTYRWLEMVEQKGSDARLHVGMTVQRAIEIMQDHNLDPMAYGFICYDQWDAAEENVQVERVGKLYSVDEESGARVQIRDDAFDWEANEADGLLWEFTHERSCVIAEAVPAGDLFSFRYDELSLFIAAGIEARLAALEEAIAEPD